VTRLPRFARCAPVATVTFTNASWTPTTSTVTGTGGTGSPLRNTNTNQNDGDGSALGNATVTFAGPLTSIVFNYTNAVNTGGGNMRIGLGPINFCA